MSEKDKKEWRSREKRGDELEDIAPKSEEPAAVAPRSKKSELWDNFKRKAYATSNPAFPPRGNRESCENYIEVFLYHTKLR